MHDGRMIVKNSNCHTLTYCKATVNNQKDSMMVGMRNFHKGKEMIPDSNFGCPKNKQACQEKLSRLVILF